MRSTTRFGCVSLGLACLVGHLGLARGQEPAPASPAPGTGEAPQAPATDAAEPNAGSPGATQSDDRPSAPVPGASDPPEAGSEVQPASPERTEAAPVIAPGSKPANAAVPATTSAAQASPLASAPPEDDGGSEEFSGQLGSHQDHWFAWLGVRNDYVRDATFDVFATNDALTVFSVGGGRTVWASGNLSLAALGLWEIGSRSQDVRGNETSVRVQRLQAGPEARYHFHYRLYGFTRLGLGAAHVHATLDDELFSGDLVSNSWAFAGDLALGAAFQFVGHPRGEQRKPRGWIVAEGGYGLATGAPLSFSAQSGDDSVPERAGSEELGELELSAPFFRLAVLGTY